MPSKDGGLAAAAGAGIVTILVVLLALPAAFGGWAWLGSEIAAAWVQAIGSIAAVLAAFGAVMLQAERTRLMELERQRTAEVARLRAIKAVLSTAHVIGKLLQEAWVAPGPTPAPADVDRLLDCKAAIERIHVFEVPDVTLIVHLLQLPRAIEELHKCWSWAVSMRPMTVAERQDSPAAEPLGRLWGQFMTVTTQAGATCELRIQGLELGIASPETPQQDQHPSGPSGRA